jgi:hypothetical protein
MNVRETIGESPRFGYGVAGGLFLVGIIFVYLDVRSHPAVGALPSQFYFTVDDGKTWFADAATNVPPYEKDGQQAVRAHVYRCHDGTKFVAYLERFTPDAKRELENPTNGATGDAVRGAYVGGREVKRPGDKAWIPTTSLQAAAQVMLVKCPDGTSPNDAVAVEP